MAPKDAPALAKSQPFRLEGLCGPLHADHWQYFPFASLLLGFIFPENRDDSKRFLFLDQTRQTSQTGRSDAFAIVRGFARRLEFRPVTACFS
jgi:hypothetical protein